MGLHARLGKQFMKPRNTAINLILRMEYQRQCPLTPSLPPISISFRHSPFHLHITMNTRNPPLNYLFTVFKKNNMTVLFSRHLQSSISLTILSALIDRITYICSYLSTRPPHCTCITAIIAVLVLFQSQVFFV